MGTRGFISARIVLMVGTIASGSPRATFTTYSMPLIIPQLSCAGNSGVGAMKSASVGSWSSPAARISGITPTMR
jgi:hypothetical protein